MKNFGERWRELRAASRNKGCTSEIRASRATPAYIYIGLGFGNFSEFLNFGIILIPRIKIIPENLELPFKPRKIARSSEKSHEKSWGLLER
jgi:hypothetical protein